jgi:hypothetical protein
MEPLDLHSTDKRRRYLEMEYHQMMVLIVKQARENYTNK